jgi:hypothetical protein
MFTKKAGIVAGTVLGLMLTAPFAFADEWGDAREELRRAEEELAKDIRQMNEARANGSSKGVENERREIIEDRRRIAQARARLDSLRRAGSWGGYDRYDDDWNDSGRWDDYWGDDWLNAKQERKSERRGEWQDAREDLLRAQEELRKDQRQLRQAMNRGDRRGVELERREIERDHQEIARQRARLDSLHPGRGRRR